jgi:hypothetical protein
MVIMTDLKDKITEYLCTGGMFNPELMEHKKVRDLLIECRDEIERLREENKKLMESFRTFIERFFGKEFLDDLDDELVYEDKEK